LTGNLRGFATAAFVAAFFAAAPVATAATELYPDLKVLPPRDIRLDRTDVTGSDSGKTGVRNVLRFTNTVWNAGEGDLLVRGDINGQTTGPATQVVRDTAGDTLEFPAGSFSWHAAHEHMHYTGWGIYQLWTAADYAAWLNDGRPPRVVGQNGAKTTSCILDEEFQTTLPGTRFPATYGFGGCGQDANGKLLEGLSVGWGDTYDYWRHDQWIDMDQATLADGDYVLRTVVDPGNQIRESAGGTDPAREDTVNNDAIRRFRIQGGQILDSDAPDGSVTLNDVAPSTQSPNVSLKVIGRDDVSGITQFRVSNDGATWSQPVAYTSEGSTPTQVAWNLSDPAFGGNAQAGRRTVYVQFRDGSGKWGASQTDTIDLQAATPETAYAASVRVDNPLAHWRLDEASGIVVTDSVGGRHGTYSGSPALGSAGLLGSETSHTAVRFDGTDDTISVPDSAPLDLTSAISLEAWIKPDALPAPGQFASVLSKRDAYSLQFNGPRLEFTVIQGTVRKRLQADAGAIVAGGTYHVVGTYDGTTTRLYVNGVQVTSGALTGNADVTGTAISVGSWGTSEWFRGTIDEPAVYGSVLSPSRVLAHFDVARPPAQAPTAPSVPTATAVSSARIDVTWQDNSLNESAFVVERSTDAAFTNPTPLNVANDRTSFTDNRLEPNKRYWYRVYARNPVGESPRTSPVDATTQALTAPTGLGATTVSASRVDLAWTDNSLNETGFVVERATNAQFTGAVALPAETGTSRSDTGLDPNQDYWYRVRAHHANGSSAWSNAATAKTNAVAPVVATSAAGSIGETTATLNGTVNPQGATTTYRFEYGIAPAFDQRAPATNASGGAGRSNAPATAALTGLRPATTYQYRLSATNSAGTTTSTPVGTFTTTTPGAPSGLTATAASTTQIDLSWADNSAGESGFVVERATSSSFADAIALPAVTGTSWSDTGLDPNQDYWFRVRAVFAGGSSGWSNADSATTQAAAPVATTTDATDIGDMTATLHGAFNPRGTETTYHFEYRKQGVAAWTARPEAAARSGRQNVPVSVQLTGLDPATDYEYRLIATNAVGNHASNPVGTFTTAAAPVQPPLEAPAAATGGSSDVTETTASIDGSVDPHGAATTYWFEYGTSPALGQSTPEVSAGAGSGAVAANAALAGLEPGTIYRYRVVARNATGTTHGSQRIFTTREPAAAPGDQQPQPPAPGPAPGPGPLPGPGTPSDVTAPLTSLTFPRQTLDQALRRGFSFKLRSNEPGTVATRLLIAPSALGARGKQVTLVVGRGTKHLTRAGTATVTVKLNATARRLLARRRSVKLWVETTVTDAAGNRTAVTRNAVVLRAKRARTRR
jgi:phosphodiesterase/alkaline phosphatase D-like protein